MVQKSLQWTFETVQRHRQMTQLRRQSDPGIWSGCGERCYPVGCTHVGMYWNTASAGAISSPLNANSEWTQYEACINSVLKDATDTTMNWDRTHQVTYHSPEVNIMSLFDEHITSLVEFGEFSEHGIHMFLNYLKLLTVFNATERSDVHSYAMCIKVSHTHGSYCSSFFHG